MYVSSYYYTSSVLILLHVCPQVPAEPLADGAGAADAPAGHDMHAGQLVQQVEPFEVPPPPHQPLNRRSCSRRALIQPQ